MTKIRAAAESDAESLSELAMLAKAHWGYAAPALEAWRTQLTISAAQIRDQPTFVAVIDEEIAGFYSLKPSDTAWDLDHLWVAPRFMQRGIGRALVAHALETAARAGAAEVTVDADPNAAAFYLECGAVRRGEVPAPIPGEPTRTRPRLAFEKRPLMPVRLEPFRPSDLRLLDEWLHRPHVAPWYPAPDDNLAWAGDPPGGGAQSLIVCEPDPIGYIRWQFVDRRTLDSVGLHDIPANCVDVDLLVGVAEYLGRGVGPAALRMLIDRLSADPAVPLVGLTSSIANTRAHRAFEKAGFRATRQYSPHGFGACRLFVRWLHDQHDGR